MKLKLPLVQGQRDPQWANLILGNNAPNSKYTFGNYACGITCFGDITGKTPIEVNSILKANKGFGSNDGLIQWPQAIKALGLILEYQSPRWDSAVTSQGITKAKQYLDQGKALMCEIDFNPATLGEEMHFVVVVGYDGDNFIIADPWTGNEKSFDAYGGFARAVINYRVFDKVFPKDGVQAIDLQAQLDQARQDRDRNWNYFSSLCSALGVTTNVDVALGEINKLLAVENALVTKEKQLNEAVTKISDLDSKLGELQKQNDTLTKTSDELQKQVSNQGVIINQQKFNISELTQQIKDLKDTVKLPVFSGWKKALVIFLSKL